MKSQWLFYSVMFSFWYVNGKLLIQSSYDFVIKINKIITKDELMEMYY